MYIGNKLLLTVLLSAFLIARSEGAARKQKRALDDVLGGETIPGDEGYAGMWFGPRLGKRANHQTNDRNSLNHLLEAADILKYYYDRLPYSTRERNNLDINSMYQTSRLGRREPGPGRRDEPINFTPRLGRTLENEQSLRYSEEGVMDDQPPVFSPRLGRTIDYGFSPRLGRKLDLNSDEGDNRVKRSNIEKSN